MTFILFSFGALSRQCRHDTAKALRCQEPSGFAPTDGAIDVPLVIQVLAQVGDTAQEVVLGALFDRQLAI
jgi:hypothetical protein